MIATTAIFTLLVTLTDAAVITKLAATWGQPQWAAGWTPIPCPAELLNKQLVSTSALIISSAACQYHSCPTAFPGDNISCAGYFEERQCNNHHQHVANFIASDAPLQTGTQNNYQPYAPGCGIADNGCRYMGAVSTSIMYAGWAAQIGGQWLTTDDQSIDCVDIMTPASWRNPFDNLMAATLSGQAYLSVKRDPVLYSVASWDNLAQVTYFTLFSMMTWPTVNRGGCGFANGGHPDSASSICIQNMMATAGGQNSGQAHAGNAAVTYFPCNMMISPDEWQTWMRQNVQSSGCYPCNGPCDEANIQGDYLCIPQLDMVIGNRCVDSNGNLVDVSRSIAKLKQACRGSTRGACAVRIVPQQSLLVCAPGATGNGQYMPCNAQASDFMAVPDNLPKLPETTTRMSNTSTTTAAATTTVGPATPAQSTAATPVTQPTPATTAPATGPTTQSVTTASTSTTGTTVSPAGTTVTTSSTAAATTTTGATTAGSTATSTTTAVTTTSTTTAPPPTTTATTAGGSTTVATATTAATTAGTTTTSATPATTTTSTATAPPPTTAATTAGGGTTVPTTTTSAATTTAATTTTTATTTAAATIAGCFASNATDIELCLSASNIDVVIRPHSFNNGYFSLAGWAWSTDFQAPITDPAPVFAAFAANPMPESDYPGWFTGLCQQLGYTSVQAVYPTCNTGTQQAIMVTNSAISTCQPCSSAVYQPTLLNCDATATTPYYSQITIGCQ